MIRVGVIATCAALIVMAGIMVWAYGHLPATGPIPIHYARDGHVDGWAPDRGHAVGYCFVLLAAVAALGVMFGLTAHLARKGSGLKQSLSALVVVWIGAAAMLSVVMGVIALKMVRNAGAGAAEPTPDLLRWAGAAASLLIIAIGNVLPKTRPNFFLGIRTPWTLSSPTTWEKTHRLGGLLVVLAGVAGLMGAFVFEGRWIILSGVAAMLAAAAIAAIYSFFVWLSANDRGERPTYLP